MDAERASFGGSPTILLDGVDPFADPAGPPGTPAGSTPATRLRRLPGPAGVSVGSAVGA